MVNTLVWVQMGWQIVENTKVLRFLNEYDLHAHISVFFDMFTIPIMGCLIILDSILLELISK